MSIHSLTCISRVTPSISMEEYGRRVDVLARRCYEHGSINQ
jgi:hypothetical protein